MHRPIPAMRGSTRSFDWSTPATFEAAEAGIATALAATSLPADTRTALLFERERMRRILLDFTLTADEVKARVRKQIPDLADAEFARWDAAGLFERQSIDGRTLYFNRAPSNLFRLSDEALARRKVQAPLSEGPMEAPNAHQRAVRDAALATGRSSVEPQRIRVTQSLVVEADAVPAGETIRAWIPYPRALAGQQEDIRLVSSTPDRAVIAPESAMQRTAYLEQVADAGKPTRFSITYDMTVLAQYHAIDPAKVVVAEATPELAPHLAERAPHIVFTDDLRAFSRKVVGDERNPYRIAQKLFAAVDRIPWAGAREYSTISNISDYALHAGHADCGQQTLLLMALLRLNGIPARWQSGMVYSQMADRILEPARLGLDVPRSIRLGADGRHHRRVRGRTGHRMVLPRWARRLPHRLQRRLRPRVRPGQAALPFRDRRPAARRGGVEGRQSLFRPVGLRLRSHATTNSTERGEEMSSIRNLRKSVLCIAMGVCLSSIAIAPALAQSATGAVAGRASAGDQITVTNAATGLTPQRHCRRRRQLSAVPVASR